MAENITYKFKQFRYYQDNSVENFPEELNASVLTTGNLFHNYAPVYRLGIQTLPGVKFKIDGDTHNVIVGFTGIYELDLEGDFISSIQFDTKSINEIKSNLSNYLLIDIIYGGGGMGE